MGAVPDEAVDIIAEKLHPTRTCIETTSEVLTYKEHTNILSELSRNNDIHTFKKERPIRVRHYRMEKSFGKMLEKTFRYSVF